PEGLRDDDVGVDQLALERRVLTVLVRRHDQLMAVRLEIGAQAQFARNATEQGTRLEVDGMGCGERLAVGITRDLRQVIARVTVRIAGLRVVVEDAENLRHETHLSELVGWRAKTLD